MCVCLCVYTNVYFSHIHTCVCVNLKMPIVSVLGRDCSVVCLPFRGLQFCFVWGFFFLFLFFLR